MVAYRTDGETAEYFDALCASEPNGHKTVPLVPTASIGSLILTTAELKALPKPEYLIADLIPTNSVGMVYGASGSGKSFVCLALAGAVSTNRLFLGERIVSPGPILYVVGEGVGRFAQRIDSWESCNGVAISAAHWMKRPLDLGNPGLVEEFCEVAAKLATCLVVIDTLARCTPGLEENSAKDMGKVVRALDSIRDATGAAVVVVHHTGKDPEKGARGSSAIRGAMDFELQVDGKPDGGTGRLKNTKAKDTAEHDDIPIAYRSFGSSLAADLGDGSGPVGITASAERILEALVETDDGSGVASGVWEQASGATKATFHRQKKILVENGAVRRLGTGARSPYAAMPKPDQ